MIAADILKFTLISQGLISVGFLLTLVFQRWHWRRMSAPDVLRIQYWMMGIVIILALLAPCLPSPRVFSPPMKIWATPQFRPTVHQTPWQALGTVNVSVGTNLGAVSSGSTVLLLATLQGLGILLTLLGLGRELYRLVGFRKSCDLVRQIHGLQILTGSASEVPLSFLLWNRYVYVPESFICEPEKWKMSIAHEIQHHRQNDTVWVYGFWLLRLIGALNPFTYLWIEKIKQWQENSCDQALLIRDKVDLRAYLGLLVETAKTAFDRRQQLGCATGMLRSGERQLLKRRIQHMMDLNIATINKKNTALTVLCSAGVTLILGVSVYAASSLVQDRRISMNEAQALVAKSNQGSEFPIVLNEKVLAQLNHYLGSPEGRQFIKGALAKRKGYQGVVDPLLEKYHAPTELAAMPITESGYVNLTEAESHTTGHAAGLWQFVPSTARHFGLAVNDHADERNDARIESDAAARLLTSDYLRFGDWSLAVLAFNAGESTVQEGIDKTHSRDAWTLIANGFEGDRDYLAKVMAAVLIMKNAEIID